MTTHEQPKPAGQVTWAELITPDIDGARSFYQTLFGWEYDIGGPEYGGYTTARLPRGSVVGMSGPQPETPPAPAGWGIYFATNDIEADIVRAVERGATVVFPTMEVGPFGKMAACTDPTGATFSFWQAGSHIGAEVTDEIGAMVWFELYSPSAKQARDFYADLLRATAEPMPGDMEYYVLRQGDIEIGGIMQIDPAWGALKPHWAIYFAVPDADEAVATVKQHGGTIFGSIDPSPFGRFAAVGDPSGATFKIIEPPKE